MSAKKQAMCPKCTKITSSRRLSTFGVCSDCYLSKVILNQKFYEEKRQLDLKKKNIREKNTSYTPKLEDFAPVLGVREDQILNVYLYGSQLFGTAGPSSDYDFFVVLDGLIGPLAHPSKKKSLDQNKEAKPDNNNRVEQNNNTSTNIDTKDYEFSRYLKIHDPDNYPWDGGKELLVESFEFNADINCYSSDYWQWLMHLNTVRTISCQTLDRKLKYKETKRFDYQLSFMKLKREVYWYTHEHEEKAKHMWQRDKQKRAIKTVLHAFREILLGIQIATTQTVTNYKEGNDLHYEFFNLFEKDSWKSWTEFYDWYKPKWDILMDKFTDIVNEYKNFDFESNRITSEYTRHYLEQFVKGDLTKLELQLDIISRQHPKYPQLYQFDSSFPTSPSKSEIVSECRGIILEKITDTQWKTVALPLTRLYEYNEDEFSDEKFVPPVDWANLKIYEKIAGISSTLF